MGSSTARNAERTFRITTADESGIQGEDNNVDGDSEDDSSDNDEGGFGRGGSGHALGCTRHCNSVGAVLVEMREWCRRTAHQNLTKKFLETGLHVHIKMRAAGRAKTLRGRSGTCASFVGRSQRAR
jgi:hypothetical protein